VISQAIILAGGLGARLGEITKKTPKPMVLVNKKPFLEYLVFNLKRHGFKQIIFSTGYLSEKISNYFGDGSSYGLNFLYVEEIEPLGTGGAVKFSSSFLDKEFLVLNGDSLFDMNYFKLCAFLLDSPKSIVSMGLKFVNDTKRYGRVILEGNTINGYIEKGTDSTPGLINSGVYAMKKDVLDFLPGGYSSLENDLFPKLVKLNLITGYEFNGYFIDIGLPSELKKAQIELLALSDSNNFFNIRS
jgi:NDP-sugar pyrophosphorylase family protein